MASFKYCRPYCGWHDGHYFRSYAEFLFGFKLKFIDRKVFKTEPLRLTDRDGNHKVPNFGLYNDAGELLEIIELKNTEADTQECIKEYADRGIRLDGLAISFVTISHTVQTKLKREIAAIIGEEMFEIITNDYRAQRTTKTRGFIGELNPMYGRHFSDESKAKMAAASRINTAGSRNPMYGKTHTTEAKIRIAEKWSDDEKKTAMFRKGFLSHLSALTQANRDEITKYFQNKFTGTKTMKPSSLNNFYSLSLEKATKWFGSEEQFWQSIAEMRS